MYETFLVSLILLFIMILGGAVFFCLSSVNKVNKWGSEIIEKEHRSIK